MPPQQATSRSTLISKLKVQFPRPCVHVTNQIIAVVRIIKKRRLQAYKVSESSSMVNQGGQTKDIDSFLFKAHQRLLWRTNKVQVPRTIRLQHLPTRVPITDVGIELQTETIILNRVPTIGEHSFKPTDLQEICLFRIKVCDRLINSLGPQNRRCCITAFRHLYRSGRGADTCVHRYNRNVYILTKINGN